MYGGRNRFLPNLALVESVRDGASLRVRLFMPDGDHQMINIALAGVRCPKTASKSGEPSEPWAEEVRLHILISAPKQKFLVPPHRQNSSLNHVYFSVPSGWLFYRCQVLRPHHFTLVPANLPLLLLQFSLPQVSCSLSLAKDPDYNSITVLHPAGNIAEHLIAAGLARVVDWHAGLLASSGGMERIRAAEKAAKEKRVCLYANAPSSSAPTTDGSLAINGSVKSFEGTVIRIWSGDQISVVEKDNGKEHRLQLSSTRGPK